LSTGAKSLAFGKNGRARSPNQQKYQLPGRFGSDIGGQTLRLFFAISAKNK